LYPSEEPKEAMTMLADRGEEERRNCDGRSLCVCRQKCFVSFGGLESWVWQAAHQLELCFSRLFDAERV
jgi:hypothetical protein